VEVRLEKRDDAPFRIAVPRRRERGPDLRRMVRVVVDDERAGVVAEDLEAPVDAEELRQSARRDVRREAELERDRDRREGVADVVLAGDEELEEADAGDLEGGAAVLVVDVDGCETGSAGVAAEVAEHAADENGGIEPGLLEDGGDHRGGRGLAVRAGDADAALLIDDLAEELLALHDADAAGPGGVELLVLASDRAGDDDE